MYARLRKAKGISPWLDVEQLLPGQDWRLEIEKGVSSTDVVIVLISKQAVHRSGFFHKEMKLAVELADQQPEGTIFLIPVKLDACEVPSMLRKWQWLDLANDSSAYERLGRALATRAEDLGISLQISL